MKKKLHLMLIVLFQLTCLMAGAQTWEEYKKQEEENFRKFRQAEEAYLEKMKKDFQNWVDERDKEFSSFLKGEWKPYKVEDAEKQPEKPKPVVLPEYVAPAEPTRREIKPITTKPVAMAPVAVPAFVPQPPVRRPVTPVVGAAPVTFRFYDVPVYLDYDRAFEVAVPSSGKQAIASYWDKASKTNYAALVQSLLNQKELMNLNDFAYYLLVSKFAENVYPTNETGQTLATWFLMLRSGYGVRLATQGNNIVLLMPSRSMVYGKGYLTEDGMNYYIMSKTEGTSLNTYDKDYAGANRPIDFNITSPVDLGRKAATKTLKFNYKGKDVQVLVAYDPGLIKLYKDFPQLGMDVYFNSAVSLQLKESLAASLQPMLAGMEESVAVDFLLSFVQNAFAYKTDPEQFGYEKFFFADELFFYPFCDCEDRSVLFSYLVRELVGLDVVGLEYPEHMATAVCFSKPTSGDYVKVGNRNFVVSDPTYIGAPIGKTMPNFTGVSPTVIPMENPRGTENLERSLWAKLEAGGCYRGSNLDNLVKLTDGSMVATGFYSGSANFGGKALPVVDKQNACFVGKIGSDGSPHWVSALRSTVNAVGIAATTDQRGNVYVSGSFRGTLSAQSVTLSSASNQPDGFVASFSASGNLRWIKKLNLDSVPGDAPVSFSASFTLEGKNLGMQKSGVHDDFSQYGLFADASGRVVYNGIVNRVFATTPAASSFASGGVAASPEVLKKENDAFIDANTDRGVAGLFAAINLVRNMNVVLSGKDAQAALDKFNPGFKSKSPKIYQNIGRISFVKNNNGVISVITEKGNDIMFDKIRVRNNAQLSITTLPSGDYQFDVLSGVKVGKMVVWYDLNFIRLFRSNGDMMFDYDSDHSQQKVNMRKDILK
ncbi:MAG: hypothetical protein PHQ65_01485 [Bacteroidales bacterium]|nr:hypothetical protein [Bacteroidales bacterium]MDD3663913.1 hypothetical protein [Bacteroidales bacterium]